MRPNAWSTCPGLAVFLCTSMACFSLNLVCPDCPKATDAREEMKKKPGNIMADTGRFVRIPNAET